jgi:hypothetical protein
MEIIKPEQYKHVITSILNEYYSDDPNNWWPKLVSKTMDGNYTIKTFDILGQTLRSSTDEYESSDAVDMSLLRLVKFKAECVLFSVPINECIDNGKWVLPVDAIIGYIDGPEDRNNIVWAWENKHILPYIQCPSQIELPNNIPKYAVCTSLNTQLNTQYRKIMSFFNQQNSADFLKNILTETTI